MVRHPVVAGMFYPGEKDILVSQLQELVEVDQPKPVKGLVSPHAGYVYSGKCAGLGYGRIVVPDNVVILGVNHRGMGHPFAVDGHRKWRTPLGDVDVAVELREELLGLSDIFAEDSHAGSQEHSLEVQVPFVQYMKPEARILPVTLGSMDVDDLIAAGEALADLCQKHENTLIVSSTDMSHYISADDAETQDQKAIEKILSRDPRGLHETVRSNRISMCGVAPTVMLLAAVNKMGATEAETVNYTNSGYASGNFNEVVAYLSMIIY